ncbi:TadE/TadG family type IV pilus assembly protein [Devosia submarina]|uniref:TadE/TadG family type IV pilus assembly protein n=1 Tax=Devosia submarina TaxID=1173082 RepID=UPI000D3B22B5|nr:pilus assembly protein [Devosia submarina]
MFKRGIKPGVRKLMRMGELFAADERGAFAVVFGLMAIVLVALGGAAVDYTLWQNAQTSALISADRGALAGAISSAKDLPTIRSIVAGAATQASMFTTLEVKDVTYDRTADRIGVTVEGTYSTLFVTLVGVHTMPVRATAVSERAQPGELEVALVLDNTFSMSDVDPSGGTKLQALKKASRNLVDILWEQDTAQTVEIALVPYADYVNVGVANRGQSWLDIPADYSTSTPNACYQTADYEEYNCVTTYGPYYDCSTYKDGVRIPAQCRTSSKKCDRRPVTPKTVCPAPTVRNYKWYGCVYSRNTGTLRLNDSLPMSPYRGPVAQSQSCLNPIVPLTKDRNIVRTSLDKMVVNIGSYRPATYIPAGIVWGINVLSPTAPFTEGSNYDPSRLRPRKALVLMTDGDNTLQFRASDGQHVALSAAEPARTTQKGKTDDDTLALCNYAKTQGIEVFTVGFGTLLPTSDALLKGCASDENHYFSAANAEELEGAFEQIGKALKFVRLVE